MNKLGLPLIMRQHAMRERMKKQRGRWRGESHAAMMREARKIAQALQAKTPEERSAIMRATAQARWLQFERSRA